ncbi:hypothetical protein [Sedimentisphaera salicampi]|uniref:hypothetical protein n=1 Tax=Sedimentisphaera salicampi TaxID=1941349 RepID=UPI000B9CBB5C|nr:hypothetical protein [Sedimentisphaera salicampi]OXU15967.1 Carbohydrate binding domain protein [Sedimentisphaera salicampi]
MKYFAVLSMLLLVCSGAVFAQNYNMEDDLVTNGGAEDDFNMWFHSGTNSYINTEDSTEGSKCFELSNVDNPYDQAGIRSHRFAVEPDEAFLFTFKYKTLPGFDKFGGPQSLRASVRCFDSDNNYIGAASSVNPLEVTDGEWVTAEYEAVVADPNAAEVDIRITMNTFADADGTVRFDEIHLYTSRMPVYYDTSENLFVNGGFETGDFTNWNPINLTEINSSIFSEGSYSCKFTTADDSGAELGKITHQSYPDVTPGGKYLFKCDFKSDVGTAVSSQFTRIEIRFWDSGSVVSNYVLTPTTTEGEWQTLSQEVVVPESLGVMDVYMVLNADGSCYMDNMRLHPEMPTVYDVSNNLFVNGGFETGDFTNWNPINLVEICGSEVSSGSYSSKFTTTDDGGAGLGKITHQSYPDFSDYDKLLFECDFKSEAGVTVSSANTRFQIRFWDSGSVVGNVQVNPETTNGEWVTLSEEIIVPSPASRVDVFCVMNADGACYMDNMSLYPPLGMGSYGVPHLKNMAGEWLTNDFQPLEPDEPIDDFESYADPNAFSGSWSNTSGSYANRGTGSVSLITDPAEAYSGSQALRWTYDNNGSEERSWVEFNTLFAESVDFGVYDEIHVWLNRHPGNSEEELLYFKFYNETVSQEGIQAVYTLSAEDGSSYSPTGWTEWVIDLNDMNFQSGASEKADLDNVVGMFFGVVGDDTTTGKGSGVIDFDDLSFVDTINCGSNQPVMDLNQDCEVDFEDFVILGETWVGE